MSALAVTSSGVGLRSGRNSAAARFSVALRAPGCICGKEMYDPNLGWCFWCGHGQALAPVEEAYRRVMEDSSHPEFAGPPVVPHRRRSANAWTEDQCVSAYYAWKANHGREPNSEDWTKAKQYGDMRPSYATVLKLFGGWDGFKQYIAEIPRDQVSF